MPAAVDKLQFQRSINSTIKSRDVVMDRTVSREYSRKSGKVLRITRNSKNIST